MKQLTTTQKVIPSLVMDSKNRVVAAVVSDDIIGVCLKRLGEEALTPDAYMERLHGSPWATLMRHQDGVYFLTVAGLMPEEEDRDTILAVPDNMEAVHMAIEIGLATWPEWGSALRDRFAPKASLYVHMVGVAVEA